MKKAFKIVGIVTGALMALAALLVAVDTLVQRLPAKLRDAANKVEDLNIRIEEMLAGEN